MAERYGTGSKNLTLHLYSGNRKQQIRPGYKPTKPSDTLIPACVHFLKFPQPPQTSGLVRGADVQRHEFMSAISYSIHEPISGVIRKRWNRGVIPHASEIPVPTASLQAGGRESITLT